MQLPKSSLWTITSSARNRLVSKEMPTSNEKERKERSEDKRLRNAYA